MEKREFWKYPCLTLNKGVLWFLVVHVEKTLGIKSKRDIYFKFVKQAQFLVQST